MVEEEKTRRSPARYRKSDIIEIRIHRNGSVSVGIKEKDISKEVLMEILERLGVFDTNPIKNMDQLLGQLLIPEEAKSNS